MSAVVTPDGRVLHADEPAEVVTQVWDRMWVGGSFAAYPRALRADVAVLACPRYEVWGKGARAVEHLDVPLRDARISAAEFAQAHLVAGMLAQRWHDGQTLAFRCYLGLNRSALIACLTRIAATGDPGTTVVTQLRAARGPDALCNPMFAAHLEDL